LDAFAIYFLVVFSHRNSPIFTKLLTPKGAYDFKLEDQENTVKTQVAQNTKQRELLLNVDFTINNRVYKDIANEDELYNYKRKKAREALQLQADAFYNNQKNAL
tara:strand:+ start:3790 stop:4101 length:312 start_codon:yes stop_codon:yes gene_type:complete